MNPEKLFAASELYNTVLPLLLFLTSKENFDYLEICSHRRGDILYQL